MSFDAMLTQLKLDQSQVTVDVWTWPTLTSDAHDRRIRLLSSEELRELERIHQATDKAAFVQRRGGMRELLSKYLGCEASRIAFKHTDQGKPFLTHGPEFSLSHSAGTAALAVCKGCRIGIDIEAMRPLRADVTEAFNDMERRRIQALDPKLRKAETFRIWTLREALSKAIGIGMWNSVDTFDFSFQGNGVSTSRIEQYRPAEWSVFSIQDLLGMPAAIAVHASGKLEVNGHSGCRISATA